MRRAWRLWRTICRWTSVDPLAHKYPGLTPYNYCGGDPVNRFDPDGRDVYLKFDGKTGKIHIWNDQNTSQDTNDDVLVGSYDAHNNVDKSSKGKWEDGTYYMLDREERHTHGNTVDKYGYVNDSKDGAYGEGGIYRACSFVDSKGVTRSGMAVHAGRENKEFQKRITNGCIRTTSEAMTAIDEAISQYGPPKCYNHRK